MHSFKKNKKKKEAKMSSEAPMYVHATENVSAYYQHASLRGKTILTICGSGDQVLNAIFFGATTVVGFDLNKRSEHITRLKIAAIQRLTYKEFLQYFDGEADLFLFSSYQHLRPSLNHKTKQFFDALYRKFQHNGLKLVRSSYFRQRDFVKGIKRFNAYLKTPNNYSFTKKILNTTPFHFIQADVKFLAKKLPHQHFDLINLSNVLNYYSGTLRKQHHPNPLKEISELLLKLKLLLSPKGKIMVYNYSLSLYPNDICKTPPLMNRPSTFKILKKQFKITAFNVPGIKRGTSDKVIFLK